jgi:serine/threonine protein kinase
MTLLNPNDLLHERYRIVGLLGQGGMSEVYRAFDEKLRRTVAIKMVRNNWDDAREGQLRLLREARALAAVDHPHVVRIHDVGETADAAVFLVMELVEGESLRAHILKLDLPEALRVIQEIGRALQVSHGLGLVHRDIKPENIVLRPNQSAVLLDFGFVKVLPQGGHASHNLSENALLGTPGYMSPEQVNGDVAGPASDQFSLAVVAFEALTGRLPWWTDRMFAVMMMTLEQPEPSAAGLNPNLPSAVDGVFARALAKAPEERYPSIAEFSAALSASLELAERAEVPDSDTRLPAPSDHEVPSDEPLRLPEFDTTKSAVLPSKQAPRTSKVSTRTTKPGTVPPTPSASTQKLTSGRRLASFILVGVAISILAGGAILSRNSKADEAPASPPKSQGGPLESPTSVLACPILDSSEVGKDTGWLGAAAAALVCGRAINLLGGYDDRTLLPVELLELPREPIETFPDDPYVESTARERSVAAARARSAVYLDGRVHKVGELWEIDLQARRGSSGDLLASGTGRGKDLQRATIAVIDDLARADLFPKITQLDPRVSHWWGFQNIATLQFVNLIYSVDDPPCGEAPKYREDLGLFWAVVARQCAIAANDWDGGVEPPDLDRSSSNQLLLTARSQIHWNPGRAAELAQLLENAAQDESDLYGKALLASLAAQDWVRLSELDRAFADAMIAVRAFPREADWSALPAASKEDRYARAAAAWDPSFLQFGYRARFSLRLRTRFAERAVLMSNDESEATLEYARLLADAARSDEILSLAGKIQPNTEVRRDVQESLFALAAKATGQFGRALEIERRLVLASSLGALDEQTIDLIRLADLLGPATSEPIADAWLNRFFLKQKPEIKGSQYDLAAIAFCVRASKALAPRCLNQLEEARTDPRTMASPGLAAFLEGSRRLLNRDEPGAAESWRPLVLNNLEYFSSILPRVPFEAPSERELAEKLDEPDMATRAWGGIGPAYPRAAMRAARAKNTREARRLAEAVVSRWGVADVKVPAVQQMRRLLETLPPD